LFFNKIFDFAYGFVIIADRRNFRKFVRYQLLSRCRWNCCR